MFKKIVSNLPFSPALVGQINFYAKRLRNEQTTRRLGLIFVALSLVIQSLAVFQPSISANASNEADMILGGSKNINDILSSYDNNTRNFRFIMNRVGITRPELVNTKYGNFKVGNRLNWGLTPHYSYDQGEREFSIYDESSQIVTKAYSKPLRLGTGCTECTRTGWIGRSEKLGWFAIREACGNLMTDNNPPEPTKCQYNQAILSTDPDCRPCEYNSSIWHRSYLCIKPITIEPIKCIYNSRLLLSDKDCKPCEYNLAIWYKSPLCKKPVKLETVKCIYNMNLLASDKECKPCEYNLAIWHKDSRCKKEIIGIEDKACTLNPNILANDPKCISCPGNGSIWIDDESCAPNIIKSKVSTNITQGNITASSTTANAGDQISYTITIENIGIKSAPDIKLEETLSDVVEYSTISDYGGGHFDTITKTLSWPSITLLPGEKQTRVFAIKVLETIPATARGSSNDTSFDCIMTNTFGNSIDISVACPVPKIVEQIATDLPVTGPKENMLFAGIVFSVAAYFYARARQQNKEIRLIRKDFISGTI